MQVLVVAGLDPSGGAGLLADATTIGAMGLRAVGVITASTVQDSTGVRGVHPLPSEIVGQQVKDLLLDARPAAVKLGMLTSVGTARAVAASLAGAGIPAVWDPVLMPTRGGVPLFDGDAKEALWALAPRLTVITPNLDELAVLASLPVTDDESIRAAAGALARSTGCAVLAKGGHGKGPESVDWLVPADNAPIEKLVAPRIDAGDTHGTGCVLSSALAAGLAKGQSLVAAARAAKAFVSARLASPLATGRGARSLV